MNVHHLQNNVLRSKKNSIKIKNIENQPKIKMRKTNFVNTGKEIREK